MNVIRFAEAELRALSAVGALALVGRGCDFCLTNSPAYRYPARDVGVGTVVVGHEAVQAISFGSWDACSNCSELIEGGDWPALARRGLRSLNIDLTRAGPGMRTRMLAQLRAAHESFRRARMGPREMLSSERSQ